MQRSKSCAWLKVHLKVIRLKEAQRRGTFLTLTLTLTPNPNPAGDLLTRVQDPAVGAAGGLPPERLGLLQ